MLGIYHSAGSLTFPFPSLLLAYFHTVTQLGTALTRSDTHDQFLLIQAVFKEGTAVNVLYVFFNRFLSVI